MEGEIGGVSFRCSVSGLAVCMRAGSRHVFLAASSCHSGLPL